MATYLSHRNVKSTKKPHRCFGCDRLFPVKSNLMCTNQVDEDRVYSLYFCQHCWDYSKNNEVDWEVTYQGDIGFWKDDQWYPVE